MPCVLTPSKPHHKASLGYGMATDTMYRKDRAGPISKDVWHYCSQPQRIQQQAWTFDKIANHRELSNSRMIREMYLYSKREIN